MGPFTQWGSKRSHQGAHQPIPTVNDRQGWSLSDPDCYVPSESFVQRNQDSDF